MSNRLVDCMAKIMAPIPDPLFCAITYMVKHRSFPDLYGRQKFNERLLYLKLTQRGEQYEFYKSIVDKYEVRDWVKKRIGERYLVPLYGVYDSLDDIRFESLPSRFALKATFGSKGNVLCNDKGSINWSYEIERLKKFFDIDFYKRTREWQYKGLKKRVIVEKYLADNEGVANDYKFWCFNGEPKILQIDVDRQGQHKRDFYDLSLKEKMGLVITHPHSNKNYVFGHAYDEMFNVALLLSKGFDFIRVDLYDINGDVFFGELTLYPGNCNERMSPSRYEYNLGKFFDQ